jgi:hypothetical protein
MLTSKPPFQSSTTDEIYRRAKERDYNWPALEDSQRYISQEAKDLVATMLTEAALRPEPDTIIQHAFFYSGYMPSEADMSSRLRELPPDRQEFYSNNMTPSTHTEAFNNFVTMCEACAVGPHGETKISKMPMSVWKEMAAEEKAGMTPMIPLAEDIVYRPFEERVKEQREARAKYAASTSSQGGSTSDDAPHMSQRVPTGLLRQPPQSFAAQQRAQSRPATVAGPSRGVRPSASEAVMSSSQSTRQKNRKELPREAPPGEATSSTMRTIPEAPAPVVPASRSEPVLQTSEKIAASSSASTTNHRRQNSGAIRSASLFSPSERPDLISCTKPDLILARLQRLQAELERALNSRSMAIISSKTATPPHPHVVVKWVDYTNKFGLGYILNDGSVGCILRDIPTTEGSKTVMLPPAGVFIRSAERHILRRSDETYEERNQPVPMTEPIKFFENNGESGLSEVKVSPEHFRVSINEDGSAGKMNPGKDIYQHRKRERIILWKKFANYMIAFGRDEAVPVEETESAGTMSPGQKGTMAELVTFYQRFGDVGCWVYCDGHLQVWFSLEKNVSARRMLTR